MEPLHKKLSNPNFYLIAFLVSFVLFNTLPIVFMISSSLVVEFQQPGFFIGFLRIISGLDDAAYTPTIVAVLNISQMLGEILLAGLFVAVLWKVLVHDAKLAFKKENIGRNLLIILLGWVAIIVSSVVLELLYERLGIEGTANNQEIIETFLSYDSKIFMIITVIILAPFVEEILFRKLLFGALEEKFHLSRLWAVIISAVLFAAVHGIDIFFFQYLALALVISGAYALSNNNVVVSIGLHFVNNTLSIILFFLAERLLS